MANVLKISPRDRCLRQARDQYELSQPLRYPPRSDALHVLWARRHVQRQAPDCRLLARTPGEGGLAPGGGARIRIVRAAFMDRCWTARVTSLLTIFIRPEPCLSIETMREPTTSLKLKGWHASLAVLKSTGECIIRLCMRKT